MEIKLINRIFILVFGLFLVLGSAATAHAITVDGSVSDWGISPGAFGSSDWVPGAGIQFIQEDQAPGASTFLNPGYGPISDVELIAFTENNGIAYFLIVSEVPLHIPVVCPAGDVGFDFDGDGNYEYGLEVLGTHALYGDATWSDPNLYPQSGPYALTGGTNLGEVPFGYLPDAYSANGHYAFEFGIPISMFGGQYWDGFNIHWTMSCGNDELQLRTRPTPEPASSALLLFGLAPIAYRRFRRK